MFHIKYIIVVVQSIFLRAYNSSYLLSLIPNYNFKIYMTTSNRICM